MPADDSEVSRPYVVGRSIPVSREVAVPQTPQVRQLAPAVTRAWILQSAAAQLARRLASRSGFCRMRCNRHQSVSSKGARLSRWPCKQVHPLTPGWIASPFVCWATSLAEELDRICRLTSTSWRWTGSAVEIYRVVTKAFGLRTTGAKASGMQTALGRGGASNLDATAKATSEFSSDRRSAIHRWADWESMVARGAGSRCRHNSTVTDTQRVDGPSCCFIDSQNKFMAPASKW